MTDRVINILLDHLSRAGTDGSYFEKAYQDCKDEIGNIIDIERAIRTEAYSAWRKIDTDTVDEDGEIPAGYQLVIAGISTKSVLRYRDDTVPGGFRTVLTFHATVGQGILSADFRREQAQKINRAVDRFSAAIAEAQIRSGNDLNAFLRDVTDESFGVAEG